METVPTMSDVWQQTLSWQPSAEQEVQFQQLYECILEGNRQLNLTRITEPTEFWEKHLWDSLRGIKEFFQVPSVRGQGLEGQGDREQDYPLPSTLHPSLSSTPRTDAIKSPKDTLRERVSSPLPTPQTVIDIGTGAGFPGVPIAIVQPAWSVTLLDSTRKKVDFLKHLLATLNLSNAVTLAERVEQIGLHAKHRERYDLGLVRAVGSAAVCAEYALPLLKVGGLAVLYRGHWMAEETAILEPAVELLGGEIERVEGFVTPVTRSDRHCLYLRKVAPTPSQYPRIVGVPAQNPLS